MPSAGGIREPSEVDVVGGLEAVLGERLDLYLVIVLGNVEWYNRR